MCKSTNMFILIGLIVVLDVIVMIRTVNAVVAVAVNAVGV